MDLSASLARLSFILCLLALVPAPAAAQTTWTAASEADLVTALSGASPGDTIQFTGNITLSAPLNWIMTDNLTIDGGGFTLSGANQYRGLVIGDASGFSTPPPISVVVQNLMIANTVGTGGPGQPGFEGGGGGSAGIGGALIVANTATVTLSGVSITSSSAVGGFGGSAPGPIGALNGGFAISPNYSGGSGGANPTAGAFGGGGGGSTTQPGAGSAFAGGTGSNTGGGGGGAGLGGGIFVQGGGSLVIGPGVSINGNAVTGGAGGPGAGNGGAYGSGLFLEGSGTVTFATGAGTVTVNDAIADTFGATGGSQPGSWSLDKADAGTLVLGGANLYSGNTVVGGGTVSVASDSNLGLAWTFGGGAVTIRSGAALQITGSSSFQRSLLLEDGATLRVGAGLSAAWDGPISDDDLPASLIITGGGTLALNSINTFSNGLRVAGNSTVEFSNDGSLGAAGTGVELGDASGSGTLRLTGGNVGSARNFTLGGGVGTFAVAGGGILALSGQITGTGILGKAGAGTLVLSGANSYTGGTQVLAGTLEAGAGNVFGTGRMDVGAGATLDLGGFNQSVGSISGAGNVALGAATLTAGADNSSATLSGVVSGTGSLVKTGSGSLALTGANTYTGGTTVAQGTLIGNTSSLQGNIQNGGVVEFNQASTGTYAGVMTGTGSLVKNGGGALTLSGANTYSGGTTIVGGLLVGSTSSLQGNILNNSTLQFDQAADGTYAGVISGTGTLAKSGAGTLTLTARHTFTGGTSIDAGVLRAGATNVFSSGSAIAIAPGATFDLGGFNQTVGGLSGNGAISLGTATLTTGANNASTTLGGAISGTGSLVKQGTGTLTLTGVNAYTGGTTVLAGTLVGTSSSLQGTINTSGLLVFDQAVSGTFNGSLAGAGSIQKLGAGTLTLGSSNTFTGTTTISAGVLRAGASNAFSTSGPIVIGAGTTLDLNGYSHTINALSGSGSIALGSATLTTGTDGGSTTIAGAISGPGSLVKAGSGTLTLTGANTYSGGTTVSGGILRGTTTSLQGDILNLARVVFDQGSNGTYTGAMSGTGILEKAGAGTLTLTGFNTHTGGTVISGGSIVGTTASLAGDIANNGSLTFGGAIDGTFRGTLGGSGFLWKTGSSTMTLNGWHPFSGLTTVAQGTLALDGTLGGSVVVEPGAEFLASGALLGSLTLNGGRLRIPTPVQAAAAGGASTASLAASTDRLTVPPLFTIDGNLIAGPGSVLSIPIGPGPYPTMQVNGVAALNGAALDATPIELGPRRNLSFLALTAANSLTVGNTTVATGNPLLLSALRQDGNTLAVSIVNLGVPLEGLVNPNYSSLGGAIDRLKGDLSGDRGFVLREIYALPDDQLDDAMRMIAGEVHASNRHIEIRSSEAFTDLVRNQITERDHESEDGQAGWGGQTLRWFGQFSREHVSFGPQNDALGGGADITDGAGGFEFKVSDRLLVGGGGGFGLGSMALDGLAAGSDITAPRAFGVIGFKPKGFGIRGGGSFSRSKAKSTRRILIVALLPPELGGGPLTGGIDREAKSEEITVQSDQWSEYADHLDVGTYRLDYMFGVRRARFARDNFTETGAGALSLEYDGGTLNLTDTDVKVHWWRRKGGVRPYVETFLRHSSGFDYRLPVEFADQEDSDFETAGLPMGQSAFAARAGVTFVRRIGSFTFEYRIRKATGQTSQAGDLRFRF